MNKRVLNKSKKDSIKAEIKKVIQERVGKAINKLSNLKESAPRVDGVDLTIAIEPIIGMTSKQIADKILPALSGEVMNEASEEGKAVIKKYIAKALTVLGVTTSIVSVVYAALFASPQTKPIIEKIINGTLPADASLLAGIIGIVLGGIVDSVGVDATRSMKEGIQKTDADIDDMAKGIIKRAKGNYDEENKLIVKSAQGDSEIQRRLTNRVSRLKTA